MGDPQGRTCNGQRRTAADFPAGGAARGHIERHGVDLSGTVLAPKDLEHLAGLEHVRELYLPGSAFTPGAGSKLEGNTDLKVIAGMKDLERLQFSLHFLPYFNVTDAGFATFSNLTNLKELRCEQCKVDKRGLDPFVNLESLDMSYSTFGNSAMSSLEGMHNLRRLYLRDTSVTDEGIKHIAGLTKLEELDLYGVRVTDRGIAYLKDLKELRKLILLGAPITDESIPVIAGMSHLRELNLYRSRVTNSGLARLAALHELSAVDLRYSRVTAGGVDTLHAAVPACEIEFVGAAPSRTNAKAAKPSGSGDKALAAWISSLGGKTVFAGGKLREVSLAGLRIGDSQMAALSGAAGIEKLSLEATEVGDLGMQQLARLQNLRELNIGYTTVSDAGLAHLAALTGLRALRLSGTQVTGSGFAKLSGLKSLSELDLTSCPINDEGAAEIAGLAGLERLSLSGSDISNAALSSLAKLPALKSLNVGSTDISDAGLRVLGTMANSARARTELRTVYRPGSGSAAPADESQSFGCGAHADGRRRAGFDRDSARPGTVESGLHDGGCQEFRSFSRYATAGRIERGFRRHRG